MSKQKKFKYFDFGVATINAEKLIDEINSFAKQHGVEVSEIDVAAEQTFDGEIWIELQTWV